MKKYSKSNFSPKTDDAYISKKTNESEGKTLLEKLELEKEKLLLNSEAEPDSLANTAAENSGTIGVQKLADIIMIMEKWSALGLYSAISVVDILYCLEGYMNMAEIRFLNIYQCISNCVYFSRYLQTRTKAAVAFWLEAKKIFTELFMYGPTLILPKWGSLIFT
jgi:hypothetical protein